MTMTDRTISISGQALHWYEAGAGTPLVLLHGGGGTGRAFLSQLDELSQRGLRVLAPDMPGFGQSDWFNGVEHTHDIAPVLNAWMDALDIHTAIVGGNSMGGRVALSLASRWPDRVSGLIILDSVGVQLPDVPVIHPLTLAQSEYTRTLVFDVDRYKARTPYRTLEDARELNRGRASFARYSADGELGPDPYLNISTLSLPTLLIWGRHDRIVPLAYGQALNTSLPDSELLVIEECGHLPHIEESQIVNAAILDFLDRRGLMVG